MANGISLRALQTPPFGAEVWRLAGRKRGGEILSIAEDLKIAEALSFPTREGVVRQIAEALRDAGAEHALVGGLAVGALSGVPRATTDADVVIWKKDLEPFLQGLRARFGELDVAVYRGLARVRDPAIDIILADSDKLRRQTLRRDLVQQVELDGVPLTLPIPEQEMVMKLASALSKDRSVDDTRQDITDLGRLITNRPGLDIAYVVLLAAVLRTQSPRDIQGAVEALRDGGTVGVNKKGMMPRLIVLP